MHVALYSTNVKHRMPTMVPLKLSVWLALASSFSKPSLAPQNDIVTAAVYLRFQTVWHFLTDAVFAVAQIIARWNLFPHAQQVTKACSCEKANAIRETEIKYSWPIASKLFWCSKFSVLVQILQQSTVPLPYLFLWCCRAIATRMLQKLQYFP